MDCNFLEKTIMDPSTKHAQVPSALILDEHFKTCARCLALSKEELEAVTSFNLRDITALDSAMKVALDEFLMGRFIDMSALSKVVLKVTHETKAFPIMQLLNKVFCANNINSVFISSDVAELCITLTFRRQYEIPPLVEGLAILKNSNFEFQVAPVEFAMYAIPCLAEAVRIKSNKLFQQGK